MGDIFGCEISYGDLRDCGMEEELVLWEMDVPLGRVDNSLSAFLQRRFELWVESADQKVIEVFKGDKPVVLSQQARY